MSGIGKCVLFFGYVLEVVRTKVAYVLEGFMAKVAYVLEIVAIFAETKISGYAT